MNKKILIGVFIVVAAIVAGAFIIESCMPIYHKCLGCPPTYPCGSLSVGIDSLFGNK